MQSEFLELRQRIKESIRKKTPNGDTIIAPTTSQSHQSKSNLPYNE